MHKFLSLFMITVACTTLAACGSDDDDDGGSGTGQASVGVTDAPVDNVNRVVVEFTAVELKPADGESLMFELEEPQQINLLEFQGANFMPLIQDEEVPAGKYNFIRLHGNDNACGAPLDIGSGDPSGSFVELEGNTFDPLRIPSFNQTGLKLVSGFTVAAGGQIDLVIDFDVRKSLTNPEGQECHFMKPALRLIDNSKIGHIEGSVNICDPTDAAVYLFDNHDAETDDIDDNPPEPITSGLVDDSTGQYEIGFVPAGNYTVALTCNASADDPEADDPDLIFESEQNVTVEEGVIETADF